MFIVVYTACVHISLVEEQTIAVNITRQEPFQWHVTANV